VIVKPVLVIVDVLMTGVVGGARNVVTERVLDAVFPPLFLAVTITLYSVFGVRPARVVKVDDDVGIAEPPSSV
jgi:hypothetical protein